MLLKIDRDVFTAQLLRSAIPKPQFVAEVRYADATLQPEDALIAMVVDQDDRQSNSLAHGGDNFGIHHQVGAISHHDYHFAIGFCQLDSKPSSDLIAHARKTIFHVISFRILGTPETQKLARHPA